MAKALFFTLLLIFMLSGKLATAQLPEPVGQEVVTYLKQADYRSWQIWPGQEERYKGRYPHGALLTTYVSHGALLAIKAKAGQIPPGEFVVKESFSPEQKLTAVNVMYKQKGYNAEGGDWFWLTYTADGEIKKEGPVGGCISCHAAVKQNDWLFSGPVK